MDSDLVELIPPVSYRDDDERSQYWQKDGKVYWRRDIVRGADLTFFRFYVGGFGKDSRHAYCYGSRLKGAIGERFRALNFCYYTDGASAWAVGGRIKEADAETFQVCDDGFSTLVTGLRVPGGYAKDRDRVYFYGFEGQPSWVRRADPGTFVSLNDAIYGTDESHVFCRKAVLKGAKVASWRKIGGNYSKDDKRVYYDNRSIPGADFATFEAVPADASWLQLARDKNTCYWNDRPVTREKFDELIAGK